MFNILIENWLFISLVVIGILALIYSMFVPYFLTESKATNDSDKMIENADNFKTWFVPLLFGVSMLVLLKLFL
ncbi:hypothetical protein [Vagococcus fluvialis]|uniref:Uncharacterized protein n=1 Tax=Vagococcus fluvialis TaxID=2738 RepID=A0A7X6I4I0_9ENTE|nr:hypothetical protein [Vagococcus fluvialis]NKC69069.1 hypothetical protein [Vagococcus fluvialis]